MWPRAYPQLYIMSQPGPHQQQNDPPVSCNNENFITVQVGLDRRVVSGAVFDVCEVTKWGVRVPANNQATPDVSVHCH